MAIASNFDRKGRLLTLLFYFVYEVRTRLIMTDFIGVEPSLEDYWRAIILYGQNVACYKFALGKSLLEIAPTGKTFVTLEELAEPFSRYITENLKIFDKQTTSRSSKFLDACRNFNSGELSKDELIKTTVNKGFANVIDAFHIVNKAKLPVQFFTDERKSEHKGITLTDSLLGLPELYQGKNLTQEVDARWRMVAAAWELKLSKNLIRVNYDEERETIFTVFNNRRKDVSSCRDSIAGYQKGKCFYCCKDISIESGSDDLADVDHFFPHRLVSEKLNVNLDGIWNLVLACRECNRGEGGKFDRLPDRLYLERLYKRNEFFCGSTHPLRDNVKQHLGNSEPKRRIFLSALYEKVNSGPLINSNWKPEYYYPAVFGED